MPEPRCERFDLLVSQCACVDHRGGQTPQEEADAEQAGTRRRLLTWLGDPRWFAAQYPGSCSTCGERFEIGAAIRQRGHFDRAAVNDSNWIADCCAEVPRG